MEVYMVCLLIALAACVVGLILSYREKKKKEKEIKEFNYSGTRTGRFPPPPHSIRN